MAAVPLAKTRTESFALAAGVVAAATGTTERIEGTPIATAAAAMIQRRCAFSDTSPTLLSANDPATPTLSAG
jgi:hypothetical protein